MLEIIFHAITESEASQIVGLHVSYCKCLSEKSGSDAESIVTSLASNRIVKLSEVEKIPDVVGLVDSNAFDWFPTDWTATAVIRIDDSN